MSNQIKGILYKVLEKETGAGQRGQWVKLPFVVETQDQYPKKICLEAWGDKVEQLEKLKPGQEVQIAFNPESREHNNKWYTSLRAWKIEALSGTVTAGNTSASTSQDDESSDLPF